MKMYYCDMDNFGDALNKYIFEKVFGVRIEYSAPWDCECVGIGSILDKFLFQTNDIFRIKLQNIFKPVKVFSSGFGWEDEYYKKRIRFFNTMIFKRKMEFVSLRGKLTQKSIEKIIGSKLDNIVLGDLGLLVSKLIDDNKIKKYDVGICPHYADMTNPVFKAMLDKIPNSILLNTKTDPIDFLYKMNECKTIISTGLHPLIAADSLGIPNMWCRISEKTTSKNKFIDYYSIYNINPEPVYIENSEISVEKIIDNYKIDKKMIVEIQNSLYNYHAGYFKKEMNEK